MVTNKDLLALQELVKKAVKVGDFVLTSGEKSNFYIDVKSLLLQAHTLNLIAKVMYNTIDELYQPSLPSYIGGMELGSVPISTAVSMYSGSFKHQDGYFLDQFIIRKQPRKHGTESQIEGLASIKGQRVLLVDDVLTTGGSLRKMYNVIKDHCDVVGCMVVIDRQEIDITKDLQDLPNVTALLQRQDLIF